MGQPDLSGEVGVFLAKFLADAFSVLARIVSLPVEILASDANIMFTNVSRVIGQVPILGTVAAQISLISKAIIGSGFDIPGLLMEGISNVSEGIGQALDSLAPSMKAKAQKDALDTIMERTPDPLKDAVSAALNGNNPSSLGRATGGGTPGAISPTAAGASRGAVSAGSNLETAVTVGAAVMAGGTLLLLVT